MQRTASATLASFHGDQSKRADKLSKTIDEMQVSWLLEDMMMSKWTHAAVLRECFIILGHLLVSTLPAYVSLAN